MDTLAEPLYQAGVRRLNASLDSLRPEVFAQVTGGRLDQVLRGLAAARRAGFKPIRINTVVMAGVNDGEIEQLLEFCAQHDFTLRLIETMPMGRTGQAAQHQYVDLRRIKERLERRYTLIPDLLCLAAVRHATTALVPARPASASAPRCPNISAQPATGSDSPWMAPCTCVSVRRTAIPCALCCVPASATRIWTRTCAKRSPANQSATNSKNGPRRSFAIWLYGSDRGLARPWAG